MKNIILLSTFVLSQTLLATTLTIYSSGIALVHESYDVGIFKNDTQFTYEGIPDSLVFDSLYTELPKDVKLQSLTYKKATPKSKAALIFDIKNSQSLQSQIQLQYLTRNISFKTDYILNIEDNHASLSGWITLSNTSGKNFKDVTLNLLAGNINNRDNGNIPIAYRAMSMPSSETPQSQEVQNYHLYTIPFKLSLKSNEQKRLKLLDIANITIQNSYKVHAYNPLYLMGERSSKILREISLAETDKTLPAGVFRIYAQEDNTPLLLSQTNIDNTPKNTSLNLKIGQDFDTKLVQKVISRNDTRHTLEATVEYKLINNSSQDRVIDIEIPFNKNSTSTLKSDLKYRFTKGNLATFTLKVKASSQKSFEVNFKSKR
ncbi:hypothetical protein [Sulfurimonas sp.]